MNNLNEMDLNKAISNKIDKSKWVKWRIADLVENIVEKVNPKDSGLEHYIGLEHLDSGSLKIRRYGETSSLIGDKLKIYKGDIIFAKRNAYLKRVAIADFDAVASAHSMVLRAKNENVMPEFLPFFLLSEQFWEKAIEISVGSLSPTINWKSLAKQEFLLPPKEQQSKIADLLWAFENIIEMENELNKKIKITKDVHFKNILETSQGKKVPLSKILIPKKDKSKVPHVRNKYIGLEHIESGEFETRKFGSTDSIKAQCNIINTGDLCYSKLRPYLDKAIIATFDAVSSTELLIYDTKLVSKKYVLYHLHSLPFLNYISGKGFGTKMPRVSHKIIGEFPILVPQNENHILKKMDIFLDNSKSINEKILRSKSLQKSLINQIF